MSAILALVLACLTTLAFAATPSTTTSTSMYPKTAFSTDFSDIWWNPSESGWGLQMVQESSFIFATMFIYGTNGSPTWVTAEMNNVGGLTFSGPLYVTSRPWFGSGTFDPNAVGVRQAGTMTFTDQTVETGVLTYSIDGVPVTKQIQRETLVDEDYSGSYAIPVNAQASGCYNTATNGVIPNAAVLQISQIGTSASIVFQFINGPACTLNAIYDQSGHVGGFTGNYACTSGEVGQMRFFEMTNRPGVVSSRFRGGSTNDGCQYTGYFSGINPNYSPQ